MTTDPPDNVADLIAIRDAQIRTLRQALDLEVKTAGQRRKFYEADLNHLRSALNTIAHQSGYAHDYVTKNPTNEQSRYLAESTFAHIRDTAEAALAALGAPGSRKAKPTPQS